LFSTGAKDRVVACIMQIYFAFAREFPHEKQAFPHLFKWYCQIMNAIELSIFSNRIDAICEEMGAVLQKAAFSPNIRDRLDYSCAVFDNTGELCAQAAHIPVHLGSMAFAMRDIVSAVNWQPGDMLCLNDPFKGGTHLPDVTIIAPVYVAGERFGFVANRAHHADIGATSPGSMPVSSSLFEEGIVIAPTFIVKENLIQEEEFAGLMRGLRNPDHSSGDFKAQIAANRRGLLRLEELINIKGSSQYQQFLNALNDYAEQLAKNTLTEIPDGVYIFSDVLDDDGFGTTDIKINATIKVNVGNIHVDFSGTSAQVSGNVNCPLSVTAAAVYYVFRCLMPAQTPACAGSFRSVTIQAEEGCLLNAKYPAAVTAGNVETSTRIVDVVLGALAKAIPEKVPAASHGSMNNIAMGASGNNDQPAWDYYETIGGGMGASLYSDGLDAVQTHMTNTLNTPVEVLEMNYPLRINRYQIRKNSGGAGKHKGGNGIVREYQFLASAQLSLLTERRQNAPWGLKAGLSGRKGINRLNGEPLSGKCSMDVAAGDRLVIETPGGGGHGE